MPINTYESSPLRDAITNAYRMDETDCLHTLLRFISLDERMRADITEMAEKLVIATRINRKRQSKIETLLYQYELATEEGIALMCLAEALLRIPDKATMDKFIGDKLSTVDWKNHLSRENSLFVNAATWSLLMSGKIYAPSIDHEKKLHNTLNRLINRLGVGIIRPIILRMMQSIGSQFVMGETIQSALSRARPLEKMGYLFSYDMLGEAARTKEDALHYYQSYEAAILAVGATHSSHHTRENPGISIKLSALHPRFEYTKYERLMTELPPLLLTLAQQAKKHHIGLTVDAEEADRLDVSLDIFEKVFKDPSLAGWEGLGLAVQAYQKRAFYVIDWLADLAKRESKRIFVRLVKGAYWDAEIKLSQVQGMDGYPVFTRKNATDVSYLACAKKLLSYPNYFYSQFGTHNANTVAAILEMAKNNKEYEFQCLHGMGRPLYDQFLKPDHITAPVRIYAPVGTHQDLLGYLVRRLLENGANSSFVNLLADEETPMEKIIIDPVERIKSLKHKPHPRIPLPKDIYSLWENSSGIDLSNHAALTTFQKQFNAALKEKWFAASIVNGKVLSKRSDKAVISPIDGKEIGVVGKTDNSAIEEALQTAHEATKTWGQTTVAERAQLLEHAANLLQEAMPKLIAIINQEGGRTILDAMSEVREAIDYCRYYAHQAREEMTPREMPGPTGETNVLSLHPRGVMACISPWNFPLAIFLGQITAALATGNVVIAKPAEQTPIIAFTAVQLLHQAGIPKEALQLLIGQGSVVGAALVNDPRVDGVMMTGSTETAKIIEQSLAHRKGPIGLLIAETGGQNAMIVDSSALIEQTVIDIAQSAFNSAGQRCSALRVLFVQEEIASRLLTILKGYMEELTIGDPSLLDSDIGPVIDREALQMLQTHFAKMHAQAKLIAQVPLTSIPNGYYFAPCAFEIEKLSLLEGEVFGPILHVIRYKANELNAVLEAIIHTGYGLTLGVQSRIEATIRYITERMPVGNMYVNRNMIGAVVGVQPFGGERLSGTGPKAGGPHYLPRLCVERLVSNNITAIGGNARLVSLLEEDE